MSATSEVSSISSSSSRPAASSGTTASAPSAASNRASGTTSSRPAGETTPARADGFTPSEEMRSGDSKAPEKKTETGSDDKSAKVKTDKWQKGRNDCLERALRNQGYSLKDIYAKGKDGKTMLQRVAQQNGLSDPNKIADGKELTIPRKENTVTAEGLKDGQKITREAQDAQGTMAVSAQRNPDGTKSIDTETRTASPVSSGLTVPPGGAAHGDVKKTPQGLESSVHGENAGGDARTDIKTLATPEGTRTTITDSDKNKNLDGVIDQDGVYARNPGKKEGDDVESGVQHGPQSRLESVGSWLDQKINPWGPKVDPPAEFQGADKVDHVKKPDGSINVTASGPDGQKTEWSRGADGWFQRNLRSLNNLLFGR